MVKPLGYRLANDLISERHRTADRDRLAQSFAEAEAEAERDADRRAPRLVPSWRTAIARLRQLVAGSRHAPHAR